MNVYLWDDVLRDYTGGCMVAVAPTVEEARKILLKKAPHIPLDDLAKEPLKLRLDQRYAFVLWGGG